MRAAPCGLVHPGDPDAAVKLAWLTSRPTHATQVACAAAGAIAAGVAVALRPGVGAEDVAEACARVAAGHLNLRIELALAAARAAHDVDDALERIEVAVGTSMLAAESVPAAVGVFAAAGGDPIEAVRAGARIGGDTDTIAAMAGALAGALHGRAGLEPTDRELLDAVTPPALAELMPGLAALAALRERTRSGGG
jgi:ADP-ribosylglycohydrolase